MSDALGVLGIKTAHLGRIYGEEGVGHNNPQRLNRMYQQLSAGESRLDILQQCDGLADYPVCCIDVVERLDKAYPGSLFVNVRRDNDLLRWLQSVERQFVGLQLLKQGASANSEDQAFMKVMLAFREMTFQTSRFDAALYEEAYHRYQAEVGGYFAERSDDLLSLELSQLGDDGFKMLAEFLQCGNVPNAPFPCSNEHSIRPREAFQSALRSGKITSQTGIAPA
ncbi:MAG: hypothetical protein Aurels2KO_09050 [Aureliella sp.]